MSPPEGEPFARTADGLRLFVKVTPAAARTAVQGLIVHADATLALKVSLTAPAVEGKANAALLAYLAKALGLAKRDLEIERGESGRWKRLRLRGDPQGLARRAKSLY
ncbi:MAG: hypothetical protein Kilf2KO_44000 [Rhodospirillales bacterium]